MVKVLPAISSGRSALLPRPGAEIACFDGDRLEALLVGEADHRDDEPVIDGHGDAHVHVAATDELGVGEARVDGRKITQRTSCSFDDQGR